MLSLAGNTREITKVRVYSTSTAYKDYTRGEYVNMKVYPGQRVVFYHNSSRWWCYCTLATRIDTSVGQGAACKITVPTSAIGPDSLWMDGYYNGQHPYDSMYLSSSTSWLLLVPYSELGE